MAYYVGEKGPQDTIISIQLIPLQFGDFNHNFIAS